MLKKQSPALKREIMPPNTFNVHSDKKNNLRLVKSAMNLNNIKMSSEKEGKIPSLCKELMKALELWDSKATPEETVETIVKEALELPQKTQLFSSIKEQLDKLSF